jgi:hypothetical protein
MTTALAPTLILADATAAAVAATVKPGMVRSWLHRRYITHHGYDQHGRVLVSVAEVQAYAEKRRLDP